MQPEKPYLHSDEDGVSKLHLSHATLGLDCKGKDRTVVKCKVGDNPELLLCSLIPGVSESCALDLLFDQEVTFTVSGATSVHLTGYYMPLEEPYSSEEDDDEYDSEDGFEFSDEEDIEDDSDLEQVRPSSVQIVEVDDAGMNITGKNELLAITDGGKSASKKRKNEEAVKAKTNGAEKSAAKDTDVAMGEHSEDDDGFPVLGKKGGPVIIQTPKKKQAVSGGDGTPVPAPASTPAADAPTSAEGKKKKKKKNKTKSPGKEEQVAKTPEPKDNGKAAEKTPVKTPTAEAGKASKKDSTPVKKYPNGLEVEELAIGKPDGKQAVPGKKVAMQYTGKLQSNGKIFDSTVGKKAFEFRLGVGEVIKGWDVGVNGMRVGDKRRLTIPPQMAYGPKGVKGTIPGNAWLTFDVELVNVK